MATPIARSLSSPFPALAVLALGACSQPPQLVATRVLDLQDLKENIHTVALAPDASFLVTADMDGKLAARALPSGEELWRVPARPKGTWTIDSIAVSPDGSQIATSGYEVPELSFRDPADGETIAEIPLEHVRVILFHPTEPVLVVGAKKSIHFVDAGSHEVTREIEDAHLGDELRVAAFSGDGRTLATASEHGLVRVWDWPAMTVRASFTMEYQRQPEVPVSVALTLDGKRCAANAIDGNVHVWDMGEEKESRRFRNKSTAEGHWHVELRSSLAFLAGGEWLLAPQTEDTGLRMLNAENGKGQELLKCGGPFCKTLAISIASQHVATIHPKLITGQGPDGIEVWKLATAAK